MTTLARARLNRHTLTQGGYAAGLTKEIFAEKKGIPT
jgi:hypothetical protein